MAIQTKWHCSEMSKYHTTTWVDGKPVLGFLYRFKFHVVMGDTEENKKFFASTPSGSLEVSSVRDDDFEVGKDYDVIFTPTVE